MTPTPAQPVTAIVHEDATVLTIRLGTARLAFPALSVRTRELDNDLDETFRRWYPRVRTDDAADEGELVS